MALVLTTAATARAQDAQLVIASTPPGATITVDGRAMGKAPVIAKGLLPGDHVVQADWGDGRTQTSVYTAKAGGSSVVQMTAPPPAAPQVGNCVIVSDPANADVYIDGKMMGKAPLLAQNLPAGDHNVVARFADGRTASGVAHVAGGASAVLQLKPASGSTAPPAPMAPPVTPTPSAPPTATPSTPPPGAPAPTSPAPTYPPPGYPPPTGTPPATSTTPTPPPPGTAPPPEGMTAPPPATTAPTPPPAPAGSGEATPAQPQLTQTAPPPEKKSSHKGAIIAGVVVGAVVVIGVAVGLGVGLSGGNSRYGIAEF